ncbi:endonuclease V [Flavobacterium anhuiense]|uniref:endonuclease V n=1 Tax=Flavobacterium anhuiense TaxID=459526 RepID=UPI003D993E0F
MDEIINYYPKKNKISTDSTSSISKIREVITAKEYRREAIVNRTLHGISFHTTESFFSIVIYLYGDHRYSFHIYKDSFRTFPDKLYIAYDFDTFDLILDYRVFDDKGKRHHYEGYDFTREDLNYDEKIKYSSEVLQVYFDNKEIFHQRGLFVGSYSSHNNPFGLTREADEARLGKALYGYLVQESMKEVLGHTVEDDFMEKYVLQNEIAEKIIAEDQIENPIKYIAGVSVAYDDIEQKMVSALMVMDVETQEIVDQAFSESEDITVHVPDLFAYNEVPSVVKTFEKLKIKPQLIFCDGHGIEHPRNVGLATHLGIELNIPTIGCPKKRLVGYYEKSNLGPVRGDREDLFFDDKIVGKALRTQENSNPIFVSIGHKISLETAMDWVIKTTTHTRVPAVVQEAINLTEQLLPQRIRYDFQDDEVNKYGIIKN